MTKYLYLEGACGISGDMTVASLLDLGADRQKLDKVLKSLHLEGFDYKISQKASYSISGCDFDVRLHTPEQFAEEAYLAAAPSQPHIHEHSSSHEHEHGHHHEHEHEHHHHQHNHIHRHLSDVYEIIDRGEMSAKARALAKKIFLIVAEAESKAHGCPLEQVHFHEVGAIDSIVDIISASVLFDDLGIDNCIVTGFAEGHGTILCQHGTLPVPAPAVLNIAEKYGIPLRPSPVSGERVTPTGIAFAAAVRTTDKMPQEYKILKSGIGLGKRDFGQASFLRSLILEDTSEIQQAINDGQMLVVECNIDDSTGEEFGLVQERLFAAGAHDVHFIPCFMKKNRPAYLLRVITTEAKRPQMEEIIFQNTTTIGIRRYKAEFTCMERKLLNIKQPYGEVLVKKCWLGNIIRYNPEYDSVKALAEASNLPFRKVFDEARRTAEETDNA